MGSFNTLDIILFVVLILAGVAGAKKGFLEDFSQKAGYIIGFFLSLAFTRNFAAFLCGRFAVSLWWGTALSYFLLFMAGYLLVKYVSSVLKEALESSLSLFVNSFLGFLLKIVEFIFLSCIIIRLLYTQSLFDLKETINSSVICSRVLLPLMRM